MNHSFPLIAAHCLDTLPENAGDRETLLLALLAHLTESHPLYRDVAGMVENIEAAKEAQIWLADEFRKLAVAATPTARPDDGNGRAPTRERSRRRLLEELIPVTRAHITAGLAHFNDADYTASAVSLKVAVELVHEVWSLTRN